MAQPEAAVALLHAAPPGDSILLIRRAEREGDSWSGHWSFPGGHRNPADFDLVHTALRELEEECGIRLRRSDVERELPQRVAGRSVGAYVLVAPFVFRVDSEMATVLDPLEAVHATWIPLGILRDPGRHYLRNVPGARPEFWFPAVDLDGAPLWGFTWRVIAEWLTLGPRHDTSTVASALLDFLIAHGLPLHRSPENRAAEVRGVIPVEEVIAAFSGPGPHIFAIQRLEVRPDLIRLTGPALDEYVIRGV